MSKYKLTDPETNKEYHIEANSKEEALNKYNEIRYNEYLKREFEGLEECDIL